MSGLLARTRTEAYKPLFSLFCGAALAWTIILLFAGGFTTSINAGMAFLDWPLSNGSINPEGWTTEADKMAEHSHRLIGATLGLLTLAIAGWTFFTEQRRWLRRLALASFALVVLQGVLGGLRVLLDQLNTGWDHNLVARGFAVAHACTAQIFLCVLVAIAVANTRRWIERTGGLQREPSTTLRRAGLIACATIFVQLVLGAVMRHSHAALAIPTFPFTVEGGLIPQYWTFPVAIHFAHRAWAVVVVIALAWFTGRLWAARHFGRVLGAGALAIVFLLGVQVYLGALVVWTMRNPHAATMHMLTGAFLLATCWGVTFLSHRFYFSGDRAGSAAQSQPVASTARSVARA